MSKSNTYLTRKYIIKYLSDKEILALANIVTEHTFNEKGWFMMNKSFSKSDLKNRMVVKLRDGRAGVIFGNYIMTASSIIFIHHYNDDLTMSCSKDIDIVQVFDHLDFSSVLDNSVLIWDRQDEEDTKEVTMAEIEEKFGCKVKIVKEK